MDASNSSLLLHLSTHTRMVVGNLFLLHNYNSERKLRGKISQLNHVVNIVFSKCFHVLQWFPEKVISEAYSL